MSFLSFRIQVLWRILLILFLGYGAFYVITQTTFWLLSIWCVLFAVLLLYDLLRVVEKSNRELGHFLMAIRQNDFSNIYPEHQNKS